MELLPIYDQSKIVSFGEGLSPLLKSRVWGQRSGLQTSGSRMNPSCQPGFKSRGMAMAVSMANHFGIKSVALPTAGMPVVLQQLTLRA